MNRVLPAVALFWAFAVTPLAQAAPVTIDFEEFAGSVLTFQPAVPVIETQGYILTIAGTNSLANAFWLAPSGIASAELVTLALTPASSLTITAAPETGQGFDLNGFSYSFSSNQDPDAPPTVEVEVSAMTRNGQSLQATLDLTSNVFIDEYAAAGAFTDLVSFTIVVPNSPASGGQALAFDNIAVNTIVPVPAAAWLFLSALGGLGWIGRRRGQA